MHQNLRRSSLTELTRRRVDTPRHHYRLRSRDVYPSSDSNPLTSASVCSLAHQRLLLEHDGGLGNVDELESGEAAVRAHEADLEPGAELHGLAAGEGLLVSLLILLLLVSRGTGTRAAASTQTWARSRGQTEIGPRRCAACGCRCG